MVKDKEILSKIYRFINQYIQMDVEGLVVNCPYLANKIKDGQVVMRGYLNGKGKAEEIHQELVKRIKERKDKNTKLTPLYIQKFAKRERIGIDCSGFAYRVLGELVRLKYKNSLVSDISDVFKKGINRTNADILTSEDYCIKIKKISSIQLGDLIRMMRGKHVVVVLEIKNSQIIYVHSSHLTKVQGVHLGIIKIKDFTKSLEHQYWLEKTRRGSNFGKKYFHEEKGDGVYRLKIFR